MLLGARTHSWWPFLKTLGGWGAGGPGELVGNASPHPRMRSSAHIAGIGFFALVYLHHRVFGIQRDGGQSSQDSGARVRLPPCPRGEEEDNKTPLSQRVSVVLTSTATEPFERGSRPLRAQVQRVAAPSDLLITTIVGSAYTPPDARSSLRLRKRRSGAVRENRPQKTNLKPTMAGARPPDPRTGGDASPPRTRPRREGAKNIQEAQRSKTGQGKRGIWGPWG